MSIRTYLLDGYLMIKRFKEAFKQRQECRSIISTIEPTGKLSKEYENNIRTYYAKYIGDKICTIWHRLYYLSNQHENVRYIPIDMLFTHIIPKLNDKRFSDAYSDKSRYETLFPDISHPKTIIKRVKGDFYINNHISSPQNAFKLFIESPKLILKPTIDTSQGKGVKIVHTSDYNTLEKFEQFLLDSGQNYIIQEKIVSHKIIAQLNPSSLNTLRVVTYRNRNKVYILSTTLKIGKKDEVVDNGHHGGFFCGVDENGRLRRYVYSLNPFTRSVSTENGINIHGLQIPGFELLKDKLIKCALRLPYSRYAGWDVAIDDKGNPILIEVNLKCPGGNIMQIPNGPLFGIHTDEVLNDIFKNNDIDDAIL